MKNSSIDKSFLFSANSIRLKKKNCYFSKLSDYSLELDNFLTEKQRYKKLPLVLKNRSSLISGSNSVLPQKGVFIVYSVCFSFTAWNTFLYVIDVLGHLKFSSSAGSLNFKGKTKRNRFQVLKLFFRELRKLKLSFLKSHPVSLQLNNVGSYKRLIVRNLKKKLYIKIIKNYQIYSYNGCRKKKKLRK